MPIDTTYNPGTGLRTHVVTGTVTLDSIVDELHRIYESGDVPVHADVMWDLSGADVSAVTSEQVKQLASFVKSAWKSQEGHRAAFVVGSDFVFGMTRMYEQFLDLFDEDDIRTFRSRDEALAWITQQGGTDGS